MLASQCRSTSHIYLKTFKEEFLSSLNDTCFHFSFYFSTCFKLKKRLLFNEFPGIVYLFVKAYRIYLVFKYRLTKSIKAVFHYYALGAFLFLMGLNLSSLEF